MLTAGAAAGGALLVGVSFAAETGDGPERLSAWPDQPAPFAPSAFIRIDVNGVVTLTMAYVEMGQGTYTSIPMLIAEELEVDVASVRLEHAAPDDKLYGNPLLGFQATGGSTAIRAAYEPMRRAGATARVLLVQAAALRWKVQPKSCRAEQGRVVHPLSGRRLSYGALVGDASRLPVPEQVTLKQLSEHKLIGTATRRLDSSGKVNGTATYGIDVRLPHMRFASSDAVARLRRKPS